MAGWQTTHEDHPGTCFRFVLLRLDCFFGPPEIRPLPRARARLPARQFTAPKSMAGAGVVISLRRTFLEASVPQEPARCSLSAPPCAVGTRARHTDPFRGQRQYAALLAERAERLRAQLSTGAGLDRPRGEVAVAARASRPRSCAGSAAPQADGECSTAASTRGAPAPHRRVARASRARAPPPRSGTRPLGTL